MADKQLEFSFGDDPKPKKKKKPAPKKKNEVLAPTSEGAVTYVDFSKTRDKTPPKKRRQSPSRRGSVSRITRKGDLKLKDIGKRTVKKPMTMGYVLAVLLGVLVVFLGMLVYLKGYQALTELPRKAVETVTQLVQPEEKEVTIQIRDGASAGQVARSLEEGGLISSAAELLTYLDDHGLTGKVQSGVYRLTDKASVAEIARAITHTQPVLLAIQPGWTLTQVDGYLAQRGYAKEGQFVEAANQLAINNGFSFTEGWFLSGSYPESGPKELALAMHQGMLDEIWKYIEEPTVHRWGVESVLIVASLIQAETQTEGEMPLIAGIIYNRLEENMPLGIDATTRYELNDWTHQIPQETYEQDTPYNTRRRPGLPPSGICCPSADALKAACLPVETDALYYLHGKDGKIHTAVDYEGHTQNIERYL